MVTDVSTDPSFRPGPARRLLERPGLAGRADSPQAYDLSPDGQRIVMIEPIEEDTAPLRQRSISFRTGLKSSGIGSSIKGWLRSHPHGRGSDRAWAVRR